MHIKITVALITLILTFTVTYAYAQVANGDDTAVVPLTVTSQSVDPKAIPDSALLSDGSAFIANETDVEAAIAKDIVLILDNSGSMNENDPQYLVRQAITDFVVQLDSSSRLAIVIYNESASLVLPFTQTDFSSREMILESLDALSYSGIFSDFAKAFELAMDEIKNTARDHAQKHMVFLTDGTMDTGNLTQDMDRTSWLRQDFLNEVVEAGIRIYGIALTADADIQIVQTLAENTGAEFYRAWSAEELKDVFLQINSAIMAVNNDNTFDSSLTDQPIEQAIIPPSPSVIVTAPAQITGAGSEERMRSIIITITSLILIVSLSALIFLLLKRNKELRAGQKSAVAEAILINMAGTTPSPSYKLGIKPVMLCRVSGKDTEHLDYIVIPDSTIGRRHALIEYKDYAFWIVDQGSINGTYVNDIPISSEIRLKHGDKIRLHKVEFEFVIPELVDSAMTMVSNTSLAEQFPDQVDNELMLDADSVRESIQTSGMDIDITGGDDSGVAEQKSHDEASHPDDGMVVGPPHGESEDETLMPGFGMAGMPAQSESDDDLQSNKKEASVDQDETILPGGFENSDDDQTLRPDGLINSNEDIFNVTGPDTDEDEDR